MVTASEKEEIMKDLITILGNKINPIEIMDSISLVPKDLSIGKVYKIHLGGNLDEDFYEDSLLYIPIGSGIKTHEHKEDVEYYHLIDGKLIINKEEVTDNFCGIGQFHGIDPTNVRTIVQTSKRKKVYEHQKLKFLK